MIRSLSYSALLLFLVFVYISDVFAESIPATQNPPAKYKWLTGAYGSFSARTSQDYSSTDFYPAAQAHCEAVAASGGKALAQPVTAPSFNGFFCRIQNGSFITDVLTQGQGVCPAGSSRSGTYPNATCVGALACPQGYTLNGNMCERPDECPPDKPTKLANGTCVDVCAAYLGVEQSAGLMIDPLEFKDYCQPLGSQLCGWGFSRAVPDAGHVVDILAYPAWEVFEVGTGPCNVAKPKAIPTTPGLPDKKPPCAATEGVLTSSSGTVACVPAGTPGARKPKVEHSKETTNGPNGPEEKNTVKTCDPKTGACTTNSNSSSGSSSSKEDATDESINDGKGDGPPTYGDGGDGDGEEKGQCALEPDSPMCREGDVKDKTGFNDGELEGEIQQAKARYKQTLETISTQMSSLLKSNLAGGGSLPCHPPITVLGKQFSLCFSEYESQLSIIGAFVMLAAALMSAFIILRK